MYMCVCVSVCVCVCVCLCVCLCVCVCVCESVSLIPYYITFDNPEQSVKCVNKLIFYTMSA